MRINLLNELVKKHHITQFDILFWDYKEPDKDSMLYEQLEPQEVFNEDGVKVIIEWELGNAFITGLTIKEQKYLREVENNG